MNIELFEYINENDLNNLTINVVDRCLFKKGLKSFLPLLIPNNTEPTNHLQLIQNENNNKPGNDSVENWVSIIFKIFIFLMLSTKTPKVHS